MFFLFCNYIYFVPSVISFSAPAISVLLHRHRLPSGMYVWSHNVVFPIISCESMAAFQARFKSQILVLIACVKCRDAFVFSARSQWASWRRRWPDAPHGPDGMGGAGSAPVPVSPIQSQGSPSYRQSSWTTQCQYWSHLRSNNILQYIGTILLCCSFTTKQKWLYLMYLSRYGLK